MKIILTLSPHWTRRYASNPTGLGPEVSEGFDVLHEHELNKFEDRRHEVRARLTEVATLDEDDLRRKALRGKRTKKQDYSFDFSKGRMSFYMLRPEGMFSLTPYLSESSFLTSNISFIFEHLVLHLKLWRVCIF
jgi:hypothetical protein